MTICRTLPPTQWRPRIVQPVPEQDYEPVGGNPMEPIAVRAARKSAAGSVDIDLSRMPDTSLVETPIDG